MALTQTELVQKTRNLVTNGLRAEAQAVIGPCGYNAATLAVGMGYTETVANGIAETGAQKAVQTRTTRETNALRAALQKSVTTFAETARILFANDPDTLLALGLQTHYTTITNPETGESKQVAVRLSTTTADVISRWNVMFTNASRLAGIPQTTLASAGWDIERLNAALDAVEAYANAETSQQVAIGNYQARSEQHKKDVETLRKWYTRASNLCKIAIKSVDPTNEKQLLETLDLV